MQERTEEILSALQADDLGPVREETEKRLHRIVRRVGLGMITVSEAMQFLQADQYCWDRRRVFQALDLQWPMPQEDWKELRDAWHDAVRGIRRELPAEEPARSRALRIRRLLDLLTALAVPVFSLERPPEGMPVPQWMPVYVGGTAADTEERAFFLKQVDDGGLRTDPEPVGKTFVLRGDFGIEIRMTVSCRQESDRGIPGPIWVGTGSVTHLTAAEDRPDPTIRLSLGEKGGAVVNWRESEKDRAAYEADPLWADFRVRRCHMDDKQTLWLDAMLAKLG